ncbi:MAG: site-specific DNA-methyltransferase [Alkalinema sp. RL_2_19]|nr:site-specific DNA-methyltransferase [Alkalinema sp. RL_2_19]
MAPFINTINTADSIQALKQLPDASVHLILSDIPYGISIDQWDVLHNNTNRALLGQSPAQTKAGAVFKRRGKPINGWSEADRQIPQQYYDWCNQWAPDWLRVLKPGASAIVFAGRRLSHRCIAAMEDTGFNYKDMLSWIRPKAAHRAQRLSVIYERRGDHTSAQTWQGWRVGNLKPSFEPILWFTKPYPIGSTIADNVLHHGIGGFNEAAFLGYETRPENILRSGFEPGEIGLHPTQKPLRLMQTLIELTTRPQQIILDPFSGSGTTLVAARRLNRQYIGFEQNPEYAQIAQTRLTP